MAGTRPENPDADAEHVHFPETVPDPVNEEDLDAEFKPDTQKVPENREVYSGES